MFNCFFNNGCNNGDPQKALLKAASMRATLEYGVLYFRNAAYATVIIILRHFKLKLITNN